MIRIIAAVSSSSNHYKDHQPTMKFYNNKTNKETVKKDFQIKLDAEILKLKVDILV